MNPALFRKLVELRVIKTGTELEVKYELPDASGKLVKNRGIFNITKMYSHPFMFNTVIQLVNVDNLEIEVDYDAIRKIDGIDPVKVGANNGIRPDGCSDEAPKRRGRKPKVRPEVDDLVSITDDDDDDGDGGTVEEPDDITDPEDNEKSDHVFDYDAEDDEDF